MIHPLIHSDAYKVTTYTYSLLISYGLWCFLCQKSYSQSTDQTILFLLFEKLWLITISLISKSKKIFTFTSVVHCIATMIFIIFWDFLMFYQIFLSPQVTQRAVIIYKHGIYELPRELPNDLRLRILGN